MNCRLKNLKLQTSNIYKLPTPNSKLQTFPCSSEKTNGIHDRFIVEVSGYFRLTSFKIYNRWELQVFENKDITNPWQGKYNGRNLPVATYYYVIEGFDINNKPYQRTGSVTLIR